MSRQEGGTPHKTDKRKNGQMEGGCENVVCYIITGSGGRMPI